MKLKALLSLFTLLSCALSCSGGAENGETGKDATISISPKSSVDCVRSGAASTFYITCSSEWSAQSDASWCTVTPQSGKAGTSAMDVIVQANSDYSAREAKITITCGNGKQATIEVNQESLIALTALPETAEVTAEETALSLDVTSTGDYKVEISEQWIKRADTKALNTDKVNFVVEANTSIASRQATIKFTLEDLVQEVTVKQRGEMTPDMVGLESDAFELAAKMGIGWNLGNSLCAYNGSVPSETAWVPYKVNQQVITSVKKAGFKSVRIPCAWNGYVDNTQTNHIKDSWMKRVKEVVGYCINEGLYAVINIHTDNNWIENKPFYSVQAENNKKLHDFWTQIATAFGDYNEYVIFAGLNEVHNGYNAPTQEYIDVMKSYNQTFVDAVRATGGKNTYRNLIYQVYNTNINYGVQYNVAPTDVVDRRLMVEVHYYDPYEFAMSGTAWLWGAEFKGKTGYPTWGDETYVDSQMKKLKTNFIDKGVPVVIGEYGVVYRNTFTGDKLADHTKSWTNYLSYVTKAALNVGAVPMYWDNGWSGKGGEVFGLFNRLDGSIVYPDAVEAIISAGNQ